MVAIDEITEAQIWLYSTLSADAGVTAVFGSSIGTNPLPRETAYPRLTYNCLTPLNDLILVGSEIFYASLRFCVRGIVKGNDTYDIRAGLAAMHTALHGKNGFTDDAYIVSCVRVRPYHLPEISDSIEYTHQGGEYLIRLRPKD